MMASSSGTPVSTKESSTLPICPFSLHPLSSIPLDNLAVIYQSNPTNNRNYEGGCGHRCNLSRLVSYLHDNGGSAVCPSCRSRVLAVCDMKSHDFLRKRRHFGCDCDGKTVHSTAGGSSEFLESMKLGRDRVEENSENENRDGRIIAFRYGPISYFLWVSSDLKEVDRGCAMERMGCVLNMDSRTGLKVIYKGKVIYPGNTDPGLFRNDLSEQMLDISSGDLIHLRKKPSLVVVGSRQYNHNLSNNGGGPKVMSMISGLLFFVFRILSPSRLWRNMNQVLQMTIDTTTTLVGGLCLFFRSILHPPQTRE